MGIVLGLIAAGIAIAVTLAAAVERRSARAQSWRRAAQRAGLNEIEDEPGGLFRGGWLRARSGPLEVRLERHKDRRKNQYRTLISVDGLGHLEHGAEGLSLRRADLASAVRRLLEGEIQIGSPAFDDVHLVQGPSALALALLDAETRGKMAELLRGTARGRKVRAALRNGVLEVWPRERGRGLPTKHLTRLLEGVIDIGRRLEAPRDLAARIAANLPGEPEAGVRLQAVTVLAREFPEHPATREALLVARQDPSREVRLRAAAALGAEGRETLLALVASDATDDSTAAGAVRALSESGAMGAIGASGEGGGLAPEEAEKELRRALARRRDETVLACIAAIARHSRAESESLLLQTLRMGGMRAGVAAARALGQAGTAAAIAPLRKAAAPLWSGEVGTAARRAIAEIQARLTGAAPGQLSLAGGDAGALSLADGEPGRLSFSGDEAAGPGLDELAENERRLGIPGAEKSSLGGDDEPDGFASAQPARHEVAPWS